MTFCIPNLFLRSGGSSEQKQILASCVGSPFRIMKEDIDSKFMMELITFMETHRMLGVQRVFLYTVIGRLLTDYRQGKVTVSSSNCFWDTLSILTTLTYRFYKKGELIGGSSSEVRRQRPARYNAISVGQN